MIGLDTNILVRYIMQDDPVQTPKVVKLIESFSAAEPGFVGIVSVVELVWVMETSYRAPRRTVVNALEILLRAKELVVEHAELIWQALRRFQSLPSADFADCLIERCAHAEGCKYTVTFDKNAAKAAGMKNIG